MVKCLSSSCDICEMEKTILPGWKTLIGSEFEKEYFSKIREYLHTIDFFPKPAHILRCLSFFEYSDVKVVILGQDPYHGPGQAVGLSFSVPSDIRMPPSLINIRKEILSSTGTGSKCEKGSLVSWAEQGVLLLNSILTVTQKKPRSHSSIGWMSFTDTIIKKVSDSSKEVVFMLWGKDAQRKQSLIDESKHLVLCSPHPSPFSARTGFFGCNHFQKANEYLESKGKDPIAW
ncbi:uracil-DNA glycosylase [Nematocida ausubeli]|uniref:Uracil-DNA glycosylase n=1 Tax=Nematocida ausubeli (strain ATCC PRA-371 / ERTm2) TaxID=1913371 RepID=A0A086J4X7_NEMA1|nr:uncharacterized protein NESG_00271 [Nematocida ausubeli]KAI5136071.1 uracil-DNA glycosylase [Nematocida ausubeli]KAI5148956.1 uracil-DNA glycosylase [Nematocida ausubeli]KAI5163207.1 uracil-DNA glycosylase [Nematocida ausubeli]KFG27195.1 hypothetical protein NESG_00271 [Nematocida ausubeli]